METVFSNSVTLWLVLGLTILILEMLSGKFVLIFFSVGAFSIALAKSLTETSLISDIILFALISLVSLFLFRKKLLMRIMPKGTVDIDKGREIVVQVQIKPHKDGQIIYQGSPWNAMNVGDESIEIGDRVTIVEREGNKLLISKIY